MSALTVYIAASFRHAHGVRLLTRSLRSMGYDVFDWTEEATPPEGLSPQARRSWMDTDHGGEVFGFCAMACRSADLVVYFGASGQDAGVEVGMAFAAGLPILGIRGPLEAPGLMLYGAVDVWVETIDQALALLTRMVDLPPISRQTSDVCRTDVRSAMRHIASKQS